ncbi:hypothetical protein [Nonomuraea jiangxiensis]|uniref:Uncharacterized protein n=1 Tax=Nonomuraea jiangxiensis TaxID=633440 RepID=A0A1G8F967_9ACTN|nr:hypothetical protein [Nonomuraea jiangxiensis]SDH78661.1 hypothetical protein SAMN05421869_103247 [Nonomuraea jiangxiensis]
MKTPQLPGPVRRVAACAATVLATLALATPPAQAADPAPDATVVRTPQGAGCHFADV